MNYFIMKLLFHKEYIKIFLVKYFFSSGPKNVSFIINFDNKTRYLIFLVINF